ncbi:MAG: histidine kinase [Deltaproteobacteria bacterium]|nr:histidine kinase [Deltaproteobacteria bacterium]
MLPVAEAAQKPGFGLGEPQVVARWDSGIRPEQMAVTNDGFLWMIGAGALVRFDGQRFRRFDAAERHSQAAVSSLLVDHAGKLVVGTSAGTLLQLRVGNGIRFAERSIGLASAITALAEEQPGILWIGTAQGLWRKSETEMTAQAVVPNIDVTALAVDSVGNVWVGSSTSLMVLKDAASAPVVVLSGKVSALAVAGDGGLWAGVNRALFGHVPSAPVDQWSRQRNYVSIAMAAHKGGDLWVGREMAGLYRINSPDVAILPKDGLPDLSVAALSFDANRKLWGATSTGTLFLIEPRHVANRGVESGIGQGPGLALLQTGRGEVYETNTNGLWRVDPSASPSPAASVKVSISAPCVRGMTELADGTVLVASCTDGLWALHTDGSTKLLEPQRRWLHNVWKRSAGGAWVADARGSLFLYESGDDVPIPELQRCGEVKSGTCPHQILSLLEVEPDHLLLGTRGGGLYEVQHGAVVAHHPLATSDPSAAAILGLVRDRSSAVWIATAGEGLFRQSLGRQPVHVPQEATGLPQRLHGLVLDRHDRFWLSSEQGVYRVQRQALVDLLDDRRESAVSLHFGLDSGLETLRCARDFSPSMFITPDDVVLVPTVAGFSAFDASREDVANHRLQSFAEKLWVNSDEVALPFAGNAVPVRRGNGHVRVSVAVSGLASPRSLQASVRLAGLTAWQPLPPDGIAEFTGVSSSEATVESKLEMLGGGPIVVQRLLTLRLMSLYELGWFRAVFAAMIVFAAAAAYLLRERHIRLRYLAVLEERRRLAHDLHDALAVSFTGISYQLHTLGQSLGPESPAEVRRLLNDAQAMVKHSRQEARRSVWDIRSSALERRSLPEALRATASESNRVGTATVTVTVDPTYQSMSGLVATEVAEALLRIAQEALVNAMVHGRAKNVVVSLIGLEKRVQLEIKDDGLGAGQVEDGLHFGLVGMRERAETLGGTFSIRSSQNEGTTVTVVIPLEGRRPWVTRWFAAKKKRNENEE